MKCAAHVVAAWTWASVRGQKDVLALPPANVSQKLPAAERQQIVLVVVRLLAPEHEHELEPELVHVPVALETAPPAPATSS